MKKVTIYPCSSLSGSLRIPADKSISHRALMFASIANGVSEVSNLLEGHDCLATLEVMRSLGVHIALADGVWRIKGLGRAGLIEPSSILNCKNSGTTMRLMAGLLSAMPFMSILDGTDQIKTRPMDRVIEPLGSMGAKIFGRQDNSLAPLVILPSKLCGMEHHLKVKSAQVKSALIIAALFADTLSSIFNTSSTRDHTERMLRHMGASIDTSDDAVLVTPLKNHLSPIAMRVPGDISSAAFLLVLGALRSSSGLILRETGINQTRIGIIDALQQMGAKIFIDNRHRSADEPVGDIHVHRSELLGKTFYGDHVVRMIDEIPALALAATQATGRTVIRDASELKVKESNRISKTVENLRIMGADIEETDDGMIINGPTELIGSRISSHGDHRLALTFSIAGLLAKTPSTLINSEVTDDSFPGFFEALQGLGALVKKDDL